MTIPSLTVGGDPRERGLAHGRAFAGQIADNVTTYLTRFAASGLDRDAAYAEADQWLAAMSVQNADYAAEMSGIALGANQSEEAVALLNARYELAFTLFGKDAQRREELLDGRPGRLHHLRSAAARHRRRPHVAGAELGLAGGRARPHLGAARHAPRTVRASFASPRPASSAARWASMNAASDWSRTGLPPAMTAATRTRSRSICAAARYSMPNATRTRSAR